MLELIGDIRTPHLFMWKVAMFMGLSDVVISGEALAQDPTSLLAVPTLPTLEGQAAIDLSMEGHM